MILNPSTYLARGKDRGNGRNKRVYNKKPREIGAFCVLISVLARSAKGGYSDDI